MQSGTATSRGKGMGETNGAVPPSSTGGKQEHSSSVRMKRPELRQYPRFRTDEAKTELYLKGFLTTIGIGRKNEARSAVNLSEGGMLLVTHTKLTAGAKVQLRFEMEH